MPYELFRVGPGGTLTRSRSVIRTKAMAAALRRAPVPTIGIEINGLTVAGVSPHLAGQGLNGMDLEQVRVHLDPSHPVATAAPSRTVNIASQPRERDLRLSATSEAAGALLVFGAFAALLVGVMVVADTSLPRAETTLALLAVIAVSLLVAAVGLLLRSVAILLRRPYDDP